MAVNGTRTKLIRPGPSEIEHKSMRFLITDRPTDSHISSYIEELKKHDVKDVVRVCEPSYKVDELKRNGITVTDLVFEDGSYPPNDIVEEWLELLRKRFSTDPKSCVAVHCVAGLGRAPVLVAIALVELGMKYEDAVELIRQKRRGAINSKQLSYLKKYRPKSRLKTKNGHSLCCVQ
ncbi:PRL-1 phosphatase-like [Artemia franciscana]|uniref:PRL-1 phosphatase-like n=1 Tax=Artemia franciscana TaxID=6661 RepID=UPI0032DA3887